MILDVLLPILESAGVATIASDLFLHFMPAQVLTGVLVLPSLAGTQINSQLPHFRAKDHFQVIVRAPNLEDALPKAAAVTAALTILQRRVISAVEGKYPEVSLNFVRPMHDPLPYPRQPSGGWEVSTNFICSYVAVTGVL